MRIAQYFHMVITVNIRKHVRMLASVSGFWKQELHFNIKFFQAQLQKKTLLEIFSWVTPSQLKQSAVKLLCDSISFINLPAVDITGSF